MDTNKSPDGDVYAAGQTAVRLLKMLLANSSPRSDTPKIEAEIERIETVFERPVKKELTR